MPECGIEFKSTGSSKWSAQQKQCENYIRRYASPYRCVGYDEISRSSCTLVFRTVCGYYRHRNYKKRLAAVIRPPCTLRSVRIVSNEFPVVFYSTRRIMTQLQPQGPGERAKVIPIRLKLAFSRRQSTCAGRAHYPLWFTVR